MKAPEARPALKALIARLVECWPEHAGYIEKSFQDRPSGEIEISERVASCILQLARRVPGGLDGLCDDYRFLCERIVLPEEIHFRRHDRYRLSSFAAAREECYANAPFMARYMNGLLISNVMWRNHAGAISSYVRDYLPSLRGDDLLEIGPGHGLFLYFAASSPNIGSVSGWDVSRTSIEHTRDMLGAAGICGVDLTQQDLFETDAKSCDRHFGAIVMSEILEHLEDPGAALKAAMTWLKPGGTIWVNVPANSPAPDHIFLVESPEHACEIVRAAGLTVVASKGFPMTGATLERARKHKLAISCVVVGRKPR
jgi:2-polyprenyl-3-methyl-5-hydroxy-6-metoxy-1,4-benzoquinol methylase